MDSGHDILIMPARRNPPDMRMVEQALKTVTQHQLAELGITETPEKLNSEARLAIALARQGYGRTWARSPLLTARGAAHELIKQHNLPEDRYAAKPLRP